MSSITLPYGASTYFTDGRFTGTEDTAVQGIRAAGANYAFRDSGWNVVCAIRVDGQSFDSDPKPSKSEALKNAVEKVYAAAMAPTPEPVSAQSSSDDDEVRAVLDHFGVDLDSADDLLRVAEVAVKTLRKVVESAKSLV